MSYNVWRRALSQFEIVVVTKTKIGFKRSATISAILWITERSLEYLMKYVKSQMKQLIKKKIKNCKSA